MKRIILSIVVMFGFTLIFASVNKVEAVDFPMSAEIPTATGVSIIASPVDTDSGDFSCGIGFS